MLLCHFRMVMKNEKPDSKGQNDAVLRQNTKAYKESGTYNRYRRKRKGVFS